MKDHSSNGQVERDMEVDLDNLWREIDDILSLSEDDLVEEHDYVDSSLIYTKLDTFVSRCIEHYETHLQQAATGEDAIAKLLESPLYTHSAIADIANVLIRLVVTATSLPTLHLLFQALLRVGKDQPEMYRSTMVATQLIPRLVHHIWAARYAEEYLIKDLGGNLEGGEGNGEVEGWSQDWNVKYVRAKSMGDPDKEIQEARNRILQCRLREESVVLLYQVCRAQRLEFKDMRAIDGAFVDHLFELVEASRHWNDDSYNYRLIKLIVALNEQFMVAGIEVATSQKVKTHSRKASATSSNIVMSVLRFRLHASNTFGENLIWMLNRASSSDAEDVCMQILVLKLLYLLFTTRETAHYFYLNDLKVLVDVFIRELSDLPEESESLRNTYLRVLHPLLTNTQLLTYPYKRIEIRSLLLRLTSHAHLRDISSTTKRLVDRCLNAQWCVDLNVSQQMPVLQIETIIDEEEAMDAGSSMSSSTGSLHQGQRRRPPAPPLSDGGKSNQRGRKAILSSTSETNLAATLAKTIATENNRLAQDVKSMPNSPRPESVMSNRDGEDSPNTDSCPYIPPSQRRRPPPPPVNRATKGSRTQSQQVLPTQASLSTASSRLLEEEGFKRPQHSGHSQSYYTDDTARHVEQAMDYLYVSEDGYGW